MNAEVAAGVAQAVAGRVAEGLAEGAAILVLGGDCTVELGTVAGASVDSADIGLIYIDLDTDLNTPASVEDGALDWMGVAHLLGLDGTVPVLAGLGPRVPLLRPDQVLLFAADKSTNSSGGSSRNGESPRSGWHRCWLTQQVPRAVSSRAGPGASGASSSTSMSTSSTTWTCRSPRTRAATRGSAFLTSWRCCGSSSPRRTGWR
jgi:hypothetical protein